MPLFYNSFITKDEEPLYEQLTQFFRIPSMVIRAKCYRNELHNTHTFRDRHTNNMVRVRHSLIDSKVTISKYYRTPNIAANIATPYELLHTSEYDSLSDTNVSNSIISHVCSHSPYIRDAFYKIRATKKKIEDLTEDEVSVNRIIKLEIKDAKTNPRYELLFENGSGSYNCSVDEVTKHTNNPLGKFVVFNRRRDVAIHPKKSLIRYFDIVETEGQISPPSKLFID